MNQSRASAFYLLRLLPLAACFVIIGCGGSGPVTYPISGTVSLDGKPLEKGTIYFHSVDPNISGDAGEVIDGKFAFRVQGGKKRVEIRASRVVPDRKSPMGNPLKEEYLPPRYNRETTLTADVSASGPNEFQFPLKSEDDQAQAP